MTTSTLSLQERYDALAETHRRLRVAALAVCNAASYPCDGAEPRVYGYQLVELRKELEHEAQANGWAWMGT